jgi:hypothetical protein
LWAEGRHNFSKRVNGPTNALEARSIPQPAIFFSRCPDYHTSAAVLVSMREAWRTRVGTLPTKPQKHATHYANHPLDALAENLRALDGENDQLHRN